jgi:hypothetical protein
LKVRESGRRAFGTDHRQDQEPICRQAERLASARPDFGPRADPRELLAHDEPRDEHVLRRDAHRGQRLSGILGRDGIAGVERRGPAEVDVGPVGHDDLDVGRHPTGDNRASDEPGRPRQDCDNSVWAALDEQTPKRRPADDIADPV